MKFAHKVGKHIGHNQTVCSLFDLLDSKIPLELNKLINTYPDLIYEFTFDKTNDQTLVGKLKVYSNDHYKNQLLNIDPCASYFYDNVLYFTKNTTISLTEKYTSLCAYIADYKKQIYINKDNPIVDIEIHCEDKLILFKN